MKRLNKPQVAIIWVTVSILLPACYFVTREGRQLTFSISAWNKIEKGDMKLATPSDEQREIDQGRYHNRENRRKLLEGFGLFAFELLSLAGLLVYLTSGVKKSR